MRKFILLIGFVGLAAALAAQTLPQVAVLDSGLLYQRAAFPSCHAATICETAEGDLLVAFFGGAYEGSKDVCIWSCRKDRKASVWSKPKQLASGRIDQHTQHPCWNPVLSRVPGKKGEIMLFYKTGIYIPEWVGHIMRSSDGGRTWSAPEELPKGLLGAIKNKPLCMGRRMISPSSDEPDWQPHFEISINRGLRWHRVEVPRDTTIVAIQPALLSLPGDTLLALMRTKNGFLAETYSLDKGRHWSPMRLTDIPNNNSGIDAMTLANGLHVMVYTPRGLTAGSEFGPRTPLVLALSTDGRRWENVLTLEDGAGEYSYPSIIQGDDGTLHIVYTYRRTHIKYVHVGITEYD